MLTSRWTWIVLAPVLIPPAIILVVCQLPAIIFGWATARFAVGADNGLVPVLYAFVLTAVILAGFAWPFALIYVLPL